MSEDCPGLWCRSREDCASGTHHTETRPRDLRRKIFPEDCPDLWCRNANGAHQPETRPHDVHRITLNLWGPWSGNGRRGHRSIKPPNPPLLPLSLPIFNKLRCLFLLSFPCLAYTPFCVRYLSLLSFLPRVAYTPFCCSFPMAFRSNKLRTLAWPCLDAFFVAYSL